MANLSIPPPGDPFWLKFDSRIWRGEQIDCAIWTGCRSEKGYGLIWLNGRQERTHRIAFVRGGGVLTKDAPNVLHRCDRPACVEFGCLFAGSDADNQADMARKNRGTRSKNGLPFGVAVVRSGRFMAQVRTGGTNRHLGTYDSWAVASALAFYEKNLYYSMKGE